jgi:cytochrome c5
MLSSDMKKPKATQMRRASFGRAGLSILAAGGLIASVAAVNYAAQAAEATASAAAAPASPAARPAVQPVVSSEPGPASAQAMLTQYCATCHNDRINTAGMSVQKLDANDIPRDLATWEKILRRINVGEMPPKGMRRPPHAEATAFVGWLEHSLDEISAKNPDPGRVTLRRLNRVEYANAVRDLLAYTVDVSGQLPADDSGYGFDNIGDVLTVSPTLIDRYIAVGGRVAAAATGTVSRREAMTEFRTAKDVSFGSQGIPAYNERSSDALPIDSRGGGAFEYYAPYDGEYLVRLILNANTNQEQELLPEATYEARVQLKAGLRTIGASFRRSLHLNEAVQTLYSGPSTGGVVVPPSEPEDLNLSVQVDGVRVKDFAVPSYQKGATFYQAHFPRDVQSGKRRGDAQPRQDFHLPALGPSAGARLRRADSGAPRQ